MPLSDQLVEELTPKILPPGASPEPPVSDRDRKLKEKPDFSRRNRLAWTQYLRDLNFFRPDLKMMGKRLKLIREYKNAWHLGVGLVPTLGTDIKGPDYMMSAISESQYTWGAILFMHPLDEQVVLSSILDFDRRIFPVIAAPVEVEKHSLFLNSSQNSAVGTRTAWASARPTIVSPASAEGLLTARHVPDDCNQRKLWSHDAGGDFTVYRKGSRYVDAAYLEGNWPKVTPQRAFSRNISSMSSGDPVDLDGSFTQGSGFITHLPNANHVGGGTSSHIFLTVSGQSGDSGALVSSQTDPISMYLGQSKGKDGTVEGISLALEQIESELEVNIYL